MADFGCRMRGMVVAICSCLLAPTLHAQEDAGCASSIRELRGLTGDQRFPLRWEEVSMDDGRPMVVSIAEDRGALHLQFVKHGEGQWAEGAATICRKGEAFEATMTAQALQLGPAANWIVRMMLDEGAVFTLHLQPGNRMQIATSGWSASFVPAAVGVD
jgi:hypothetical protein